MVQLLRLCSVQWNRPVVVQKPSKPKNKAIRTRTESVVVLRGELGGAGAPQTCSAPPPGTILGRYKISLMSSYLELGHACAT